MLVTVLIVFSLSVSLRASSQCYTKINVIRLGMSALFVMLMAFFLAEAWYRKKVSPSRPRLKKTKNFPIS